MGGMNESFVRPRIVASPESKKASYPSHLELFCRLDHSKRLIVGKEFVTRLTRQDGKGPHLPVHSQPRGRAFSPFQLTH